MKFWVKAAFTEKQREELSEIFDLVLASCSRETSSDPANWTEDNPLYGHCAIVAIIINGIFGGKILRASLLKVKGYEKMSSHYWNRLPNGVEVDLTSGQFKGNDRDLVPEGKDTKRSASGKELPITIESLLAYKPTKKRLIIFSERIHETFHRQSKNEMCPDANCSVLAKLKGEKKN